MEVFQASHYQASSSLRQRLRLAVSNHQMSLRSRTISDVNFSQSFTDSDQPSTSPRSREWSSAFIHKGAAFGTSIPLFGKLRKSMGHPCARLTGGRTNSAVSSVTRPMACWLLTY